ncbi:insulinase family protein [Patescibacteria group bacterium]|nr:insulinase family protein [Patescibacteria group bacterium]
MLNVSKIDLPNKLRIVTVPMKSTETVTIMIMIKAGSRYEVQSIRGISHFLEHMFFKGGERYETPRAVAEAIDSVGGIFNAFTGNQFVAYFIKVAKEHTETAFDVLSDMLLNAKFNEEGLNRERGVVLEEYKMIHDDPKRLVDDEFEAMLIGNHPLGWSTIGLPKVIKSLQRKDFVEYRDKLYTAPNIVVSVAGNIEPSEVKKLTAKYLPCKKSAKVSKAIPYHPGKLKKKIKIIYKATKQAHLILGVPTFGAFSPHKYTAKLLAAVLGGGMSSRLFTSVRERHGLAYYVYGSWMDYADVGYLMAKAGVDKSRIDLAIHTILDEFKFFITEKVSDEELKKAKEFVIGHLILGLEDSSEVAYEYGSQELLYDEIDTLADKKRKIQAVTAEQIQELAKNIFKDNAWHLIVIGPYKDSKRFAKLLK